MDQNFLNVYHNQCVELCQTIRIKSHVIADVVNTSLIKEYGADAVDEDVPSTWKYYLNICGEYHPTDRPIYITSLDTLEVILFSKENLAIHITTAAEYQYGSRYYLSLINEYPELINLILGVLYPAKMEEVLEAEEGSVLSYPKHLVQEQEATLIHDLEIYIKGQMSRWFNPTFNYSDPLYTAAFFAITFLNLLPKLLNLRLERCRTIEAHDFHISCYLASHGRLDRFMPYMTLKQKLYFYRNIQYIERHAGFNEQLSELIDVILTERKIPISNIVVKQLDQFDENKYPVIVAERIPLNAQYNTENREIFNFDILLNKESRTAYGNVDYLTLNKDKLLNSVQIKHSSIIQTKDFESVMYDYSGAVPDPLKEVLLREWISLASKDRYNVLISFKDPSTSEYLRMFAKDAFIYFYYLTLKMFGHTVSVLPNYFNQFQRVAVKPTVNQLLNLVDSEYRYLSDTFAEVLNRQPTLPVCYSTQSFFNYANKIYEENLYQWFITSNTHDMYERGYLEGGFQALYAHQDIVFNEDVDMSAWMFRNNISEKEFTYAQLEQLTKNIFLSATGLTEDNTKSIVNIQKAMVKLFCQLSSYSVQVLREINEQPIVILNWPAVRLGNITVHKNKVFDTRDRIDVDIVDVNDVESTTELSMVPYEYREDSILIKDSLQSFEITAGPVGVVEIIDRKNIPIDTSSVTMDISYPEFDPEVSGNCGYFGKEFMLLLTAEQLSAIK